MKISEIRQVIGEQLQGAVNDDLDIRYLLTDSRQLDEKHADQTLFFAIKTDKNDGANMVVSIAQRRLHHCA